MAAADDPNSNPGIAVSDESGEYEHDDVYADDEDEEEEEDDEDDYDYADSDDPSLSSSAAAEIRRLAAESAPLRVHAVSIRGNAKTRAAVIQAEVDDLFRDVSSFPSLVRASVDAAARLRRLDVFDDVGIVLDAGPEGAPGTAEVVIEVAEAAGVIRGRVGGFLSAEAEPISLEGSFKLKNLLGYADIWDASCVKWCDQAGEISGGIYVPRLKAIPTPLMARISLVSEDWLKLFSFNERLMGISFGLLSTMHHNLVYNLSWRTLTDPSRMSSKVTKRDIGESLLSSIKYTYKIDTRDSYTRPTQGYAFRSSSEVGGLAPKSINSRLIKQEVEFRGSLPLSIINAAINVGVSAGLMMPWGAGSVDGQPSCPEQYYMRSSPFWSFGWPSSLFGFKSRRLIQTKLPQPSSGNARFNELTTPMQQDTEFGGNLAVAAFADVSFDLPWKLLRDIGIYGHAFVSAGNITKLTVADYKNISVEGFIQTVGSSAGLGLVFPTKLFRIELNYCRVLKQYGDCRAKTGLQFNFLSP